MSRASQILDKPASEKRRSSTTTITTKEKSGIKKQEGAVIAWSTIRYFGLVKQAKDDRALGFLAMDGKSHFVKSGDVMALFPLERFERIEWRWAWGRGWSKSNASANTSENHGAFSSGQVETITSN